MFWGSMSFIFEVMIYIGLGLPLANVLLGQLGGGSDGAPELDTDVSGDFSGDLELDADVSGDFSGDLELDADVSGDVSGDLVASAPGAGELSASHGMPLRFNVYCLCLAMVVMGAMGVFAMETMIGMQQILTLALGLALALGAYTLLYRFLILPLKKNDAAALRSKDLQFRHAKVSFRILPDSPGKIETTDATGAAISYQAQMDPDICKAARISEGDEVIITEIFQKDGLCYVTLPQRKQFS